MINRAKLFSLLTVVLVAFSLVIPAQAKNAGDNPPPNTTGWGEFFQTDGKLKPGVIDGGEVSQPVNWMPNLGPWGIKMNATYHVYTSPDGSTMMTPTASTLLFMAMNPKESGLINSNGQVGLSLGFALEGLGNLAGGNTTPQQLLSGIMQALGGNGITQVDADKFADAIINNQGNVWAFLSFGTDTGNIFQQLLTTSLSDQNLYLLAMLYNSCTDSPAGCPPELCQANPAACGLPITTPVVTQTPPPTCPGPSISQAQPSLSIAAVDPGYPLVVGQDKDKRGADAQASVSIPPVIYTWYEPIFETENVCHDGSDGTPACKKEKTFKGCQAHSEALPEKITNARATATISDASRAWIVGDLGSQWYGAYVHSASFDLKNYGSPSTGCTGGGTCSFSLFASRVPFADPGIFNLLVSVNTAGTFYNGKMITNPRVLSKTGQVKIWVVLPTLIDATTNGMPEP